MSTSLRTSSRCHRSSVWGLDRERGPPTSRRRPARRGQQGRSRRRKDGPLACRCSTFTWCRSTKSSMSLWSCGRRPVPRTRRTRKERSENSIDLLPMAKTECYRRLRDRGSRILNPSGSQIPARHRHLVDGQGRRRLNRGVRSASSCTLRQWRSAPIPAISGVRWVCALVRFVSRSWRTDVSDCPVYHLPTRPANRSVRVQSSLPRCVWPQSSSSARAPVGARYRKRRRR